MVRHKALCVSVDGKDALKEGVPINPTSLITKYAKEIRELEAVAPPADVQCQQLNRVVGHCGLMMALYEGPGGDDIWSSDPIVAIGHASPQKGLKGHHVNVVHLDCYGAPMPKGALSSEMLVAVACGGGGGGCCCAT